MLPNDPRHGTYAGAIAHWLDGGRPCDQCATAETRYRKQRKLRHLQGNPPLVPSIGLVRRYEALHALGYTGPQIAAAVGMPVNTLRSIRYHGSELVRAETFRRFAEGYERLCMTQPAGRYANRARTIARRRGWAPPLAWDDIDDPDETPNTGTPDGATRGPGTRRRDQIIEDVEWMADADETLTTVCNRLGMTPETLYATCRRTGRYDLYARLSDREPLGHLARDMRAIKRGAA